MIHRKALKGVLHNFLVTYTSRYSDYGGYWLFGVLLPELDVLSVDLLGTADGALETPLVEFTRKLAVEKFKEQMQTARLPLFIVARAYLTISKCPEPYTDMASHYVRVGHDVRFCVEVVSDHGLSLSRQCSLFVAPHDSKRETRSSRAA